MPPRQEQSQFISPVSSLKAPCWEASSSVSERGPVGGGTVVGSRVVGGSGESAVEAEAMVEVMGVLREEGESEERVGRGVGVEGGSGG